MVQVLDVGDINVAGLWPEAVNASSIARLDILTQHELRVIIKVTKVSRLDQLSSRWQIVSASAHVVRVVANAENTLILAAHDRCDTESNGSTWCHNPLLLLLLLHQIIQVILDSALLHNHGLTVDHLKRRL